MGIFSMMRLPLNLLYNGSASCGIQTKILHGPAELVVKRIGFTM